MGEVDELPICLADLSVLSLLLLRSTSQSSMAEVEVCANNQLGRTT